MSEHGHCHGCGGSDGHHFNDCIYDGTDGGYSSYSRGKGTNVSTGKCWFIYIIIQNNNQDNLHSYGRIPFGEYGHEFCVKE